MKSLPLTNKTSRAALLLAALVIVLLFGWWMVGRADREMRTELLQSSVTVAQTVGIDIDASAWKWTVAAKVALPMGMLLLLLIGATAAFISTRSVDSSPKPVLRRLMPPLAVIVILLMVGGGWLIYREHELMLSKETANDKAEVAADLRIVLEQQAAGLAAAAQSIAVSPGVQEALLEKDAASLLATWQPMFETLRRENHITHLYFFDASRTCLLRVHNPEKRGDRIDRFTAMEAERTGKTATGIELGPLGTFTLRVVRPVFKGGALVGYVELGKEIEDALQVLHSRSGNHLAVVIDKNHLSRQSWENGMRMLARDADWDRLRHNAIIYANQGRLPDAFVAWADQSPAEHASQQDREISFAGKSWRVSASPLIDAPGNEVGDLLIMRDVTASKSAFARELTLGGTFGAVVLSMLMGFIYVLLRRTDTAIRAQQVELRESEQSYRNQFANNSTVMLLLDPSDGRILDANDSALAFYGYSRERILTMRIADINTLADSEIRLAMASIAAGRGKDFVFTHRLADGSLRDVEVSSCLIQFKGLPVLHSIIHDITERKQAEAKLLETNKHLEEAIALANEMARQAEKANLAACRTFPSLSA